MDLLVFVVALVGLALTADGLTLLGGVTFFVPLIAFAFRLARRPRMMTILPFSFASHFVVSVLAVGAILIAGNRTPVVAMGSLAFAVYYFVCVSLSEKKVRHGRGAWTTTDAARQPVAYWAWMTLFAALAALLLGFLFVNVMRVGRNANETNRPVVGSVR